MLTTRVLGVCNCRRVPLFALQAPTPGVEAHAPPAPAAAPARGISIDIDEAELLDEVEMGGMSHGELVGHVRRVQQELLGKVRSLLCCLLVRVGGWRERQGVREQIRGQGVWLMCWQLVDHIYMAEHVVLTVTCDCVCL